MCGICGFIAFDRSDQAENKKIIEVMNRQLFHRGPDQQDTLVFDNVSFGFSRLSIIGLNNGMQPIYNENKDVLVICNGEIFNYLEIREELKANGHRFKTESDVEVIVHLYEDKGIRFLNDLNGQFAFALYDKRRKRLFCARDQMGIVPFFYTFQSNTFIFASEIKSILKHPQVRPIVDPVGLDQIMTFAGLISPRTMFKNIHSLENGHMLLVDAEGTISDKEYWDLEYPKHSVIMNGKSEDAYVDELEALFENSIKLRLRADVPTGLYLSGGLDSSAIAMKINQLKPGLSKVGFSIDFPDQLHSESRFQQIIAEHSNTQLNQKTFEFDDISKRLVNSIYHSECPIKETYNTASLALSEEVHSNAIKVVLSGEGADELFAGYVGYRFDKMRSENLLKDDCGPMEKRARYDVWEDDSFFYEMNFTNFNKTKKKLFSRHLRASFNQVNSLNHFVVNKSRIRDLDVLNKRAYIDYKIRLVDHLVSDHGDRMALANSVEARYPFLDKDLAEFSTRVPTELKLNNFTEKYLVRKMADRFVPKSIVDREKFHFIAPGSPFLMQSNIEYIQDLLSYSQIKRQGYFDPDYIEILKEKYSKKDFVINAPYETDLLIIVITFGILLEQFFE